jgi:hypothetical protein
MTLFAYAYQYGLWILAAMFCGSVLLLIRCIKGLLHTISASRLCAVPLRDRQEIHFPEAGKVVLAIEGPLLSRRFAKLGYALIGPDGIEVPGRRPLLRMRTTGLTTATLELKFFNLAHPGPHLFVISGLGGAQPNDGAHQMVFSRPHRRQLLLFVLGIVLSSVGLIGSLVLFLIRLLVVGGSP